MNKKYYKYMEIIEEGEIKDKGYFNSYEDASKYLHELYPELTKKYGLTIHCLKKIKNNRIRIRKKGPQVNEIIKIKDIRREENVRIECKKIKNNFKKLNEEIIVLKENNEIQKLNEEIKIQRLNEEIQKLNEEREILKKKNEIEKIRDEINKLKAGKEEI